MQKMDQFEEEEEEEEEKKTSFSDLLFKAINTNSQKQVDELNQMKDNFKIQVHKNKAYDYSSDVAVSN